MIPKAWRDDHAAEMQRRSQTIDKSRKLDLFLVTPDGRYHRTIGWLQPDERTITFEIEGLPGPETFIGYGKYPEHIGDQIRYYPFTSSVSVQSGDTINASKS